IRKSTTTQPGAFVSADSMNSTPLENADARIFVTVKRSSKASRISKSSSTTYTIGSAGTSGRFLVVSMMSPQRLEDLMFQAAFPHSIAASQEKVIARFLATRDQNVRLGCRQSTIGLRRHPRRRGARRPPNLYRILDSCNRHVRALTQM